MIREEQGVPRGETDAMTRACSKIVLAIVGG